MGTLTAAQLEDEVRSSLGGRHDLDARLRRVVNLGQQRLARIHDFDEMQNISETSITNTGAETDRFLTMPTLREIYSIVLLDGANSRKLVGQTAQWMDRWQSKPDYWARNRPYAYCIWGNTVEMFPLQDATYTLRMRWTAWPSDLVDDGDISQFNQKDEVLIELALSYLYRSLGKEDEATKHEKWAMATLGEAAEHDRMKPDITHRPSASDADVVGTGAGTADPWNNPFIRSTDG